MQLLLEVLAFAGAELEQGRGEPLLVVNIMELLISGLKMLPLAESQAFVAARGSLLLQVLGLIPRVMQQINEGEEQAIGNFAAMVELWSTSQVRLLINACQCWIDEEVGKLLWVTWSLSLVSSLIFF